MSKKKRPHENGTGVATLEQADHPAAGAGPGDDGARPKLTEKEYQKELRRLHGDLVAMQALVVIVALAIVADLLWTRSRGRPAGGPAPAAQAPTPSTT